MGYFYVITEVCENFFNGLSKSVFNNQKQKYPKILLFTLEFESFKLYNAFLFLIILLADSLFTVHNYINDIYEGYFELK